MPRRSSQLRLCIEALEARCNLSAVAPLGDPPAALIKITVDGGGVGNSTILGSNGVDLLRGGGGDDFIDGQQGNHVASLGAGDDVYQWDPGDGSDTVEGQDGVDSMLFNRRGR